MYLHTHIYFANRFEPGVLFPDTIRLPYDSPLVTYDNGRILDVRLEFKDVVPAEGYPIKLNMSEENSFTLQPIYGHVALYFVGAPEDFDLADMIAGKEVDSTILSEINTVYSVVPTEIPTDLASIDFDKMLLCEFTDSDVSGYETISFGALDFPVTVSPVEQRNFARPAYIELTITIN